MLYILSCSPYKVDLISLLRILQFNDDLLLISDGVVSGINKSLFFNILNTSFCKKYALKNDVIARGLFNYLSPSIEIINYNNFVKLTEKNLQCIFW